MTGTSYPNLDTATPSREKRPVDGGSGMTRVHVWTGTAVVVLGGLDFSRQAPRSDGLVWTPAG
jgi:hypothetical protein